MSVQTRLMSGAGSAGLTSPERYFKDPLHAIHGGGLSLFGANFANLGVTKLVDGQSENTGHSLQMREFSGFDPAQPEAQYLLRYTGLSREFSSTDSRAVKQFGKVLFESD